MIEDQDNQDQLGKEIAQAELEKLKTQAEWRRLSKEAKEKIASLIIAGLYIAYAWAFMCENILEMLQMLGALAVPLSCIWFSEALGNYTGFLHGTIITTKSHPSVIRLMGWIFLLFPLVLAIVVMLRGGGTCPTPQ